MWKRMVTWFACGVMVFLTATPVAESRAGSISVRFDQDVYIVNGPGDPFVAKILIDGDDLVDGIQAVENDIFSYGIKVSFDSTKANVAALADVVTPPEMNFFGFSAPSLASIVPAGEVALHANVDQFNNPLVAYIDSILATVTFTNLASAIDSYPLTLDFSRDLGINEDFFVDGGGTTIDPMITFVPSQVTVVPEPSPARMLWPLVFVMVWSGLKRGLNRQRLRVVTNIGQ